MEANMFGYVVLRKPEFNFDELGRGAFLPYAPKIKEVYYGGIDRMDWFDLDEDFYGGVLPNELVEVKNSICSPSPENDIELCQNIGDAQVVLEYSNRLKNRNELVAIASDKDLASEILSKEGVNYSVIGCDLYCEGYGSAIREGIFTKPELFMEFSKDLNKNGVFDSDYSLMNKYIDSYKAIALPEADILETMEGPIKKIFLYRIA
jgi:hypothetical protein